MKDITDNQAASYGVFSHHQKMDNGELRFRLQFADGTSYIRTEGTATGAWQNSHKHQAVHEMFIVQTGWIVFVELVDRVPIFKRYSAGDYFTTTPGYAHNMYVSADTIIQCVKYGTALKETADWIAAPDLDELTKKLSEQDLLTKIDRD
ncbi:hypothetical protein [Furfurilactobacillus entadae]|uniref:hypothetical protein n=1 Tax=Furfurilactobacillus entadae TaxID=2922307 RepID=UPI0035E664B2